MIFLLLFIFTNRQKGIVPPLTDSNPILSLCNIFVNSFNKKIYCFLCVFSFFSALLIQKTAPASQSTGAASVYTLFFRKNPGKKRVNFSLFRSRSRRFSISGGYRNALSPLRASFILFKVISNDVQYKFALIRV